MSGNSERPDLWEPGAGNRPGRPDYLSLDRNAPIPRAFEPPSHGRVITIPQVGSLHHRYTRAS